MLLHGNTEHLACTGAIDVLSLREYFGAPGFACEVRKDSGFDGGEIADDKLISWTGYEGCPD